jgi:multimeric flavodoxin WrbA
MEKIKILGIAGSPRHANTEIMIREALKGAELLGNVETKFLSVAGKEINGCTACNRCATGARIEKLCPTFDDDAQEFLEAMVWCDGMVIGSPVYWGGISAQLKALLDRTMCFCHYSSSPFKGGLGNKTLGALAMALDIHGGQELVINNIHSFGLVQDMVIVASGPIRPTVCYYGGACSSVTWTALDSIKIRPDGQGLKSCRSTGAKVAHVARLIKEGKTKLGYKEYYENFIKEESHG